MELFIGVVRGRTVNSTRGQQHKQHTEPAKNDRKDPAGRKPIRNTAGKGKPNAGKRNRGNHPRRRRRS